MNADGVIRLHKIGDKMAMSTKQRMIDDAMNPEEGRDSLTQRVKDAIKKQDWDGAAACLTILWYQDWRHHLDRDFTVDGEEPEHSTSVALFGGEEPEPERASERASERAVAVAPRGANRVGWNVVRFPVRQSAD